MAISLIDIGANLTAKPFAADRDQVIDRAIAAGVKTMIVTGSTVADSEAALQLARQRPGVLYATAGVHPHHAADCDANTVPALRHLATAPEVVAIGEAGLDYFRDLSPRPVQRHCLAAHIELAVELGKPLFLHERDAHSDMLAVLTEWRSRFDRAVIHCFTGSAEALRAYLQLDLHIGITGWICDERRGRHLLDLVAEIPPERLMLETDAPYLLPRTLRPKPKSRRNEPAFLPHVLDTVASATGRPREQVAAAASRTAAQFFGLPG